MRAETVELRWRRAVLPGLSQAETETNFDACELTPRVPRRDRNPPLRRGRKPVPVAEIPIPLSSKWIDPPGFPEALNLHIKRHGESYYQLHKALFRTGEKFTASTIKSWLAGERSPGSADTGSSPQTLKPD